MEVSLPIIYEALKHIPEKALMTVKRKSRIFRPYQVAGNLVLAEIDIAIMKKYDDKIGFLVLVDTFSHYVSTKALKSKKKQDVIGAVDHILKKTGKFSEIQR